MTINPNLTLDPLEIARSFSQSAQTYDQVAVLQREIGNRLLERLDMIRLKPQVIADLGSGTGHFTRLLRQRYRKARVYGFDRAIGMLQFAKQKTHWLSRERFLAADVVALPLQEASVDLAFANLSLHWCPHLPSVFSEIYRVLKPGGFLFLASWVLIL
jgi:Methylase involved in ubiquinone/menaquinone biosynthesis